MKAGKALDSARRRSGCSSRNSGALYAQVFGEQWLVIRIQPEEAITLKISNKIPGLGMNLNRTSSTFSTQRATRSSSFRAYRG